MLHLVAVKTVYLLYQHKEMLPNRGKVGRVAANHPEDRESVRTAHNRAPIQEKEEGERERCLCWL